MLGGWWAFLELGSDLLADRCEEMIELALDDQRFGNSKVGAHLVDGIALNGVLALAEFKRRFAVLDLQEYLPVLVEPEPKPIGSLARLEFQPQYDLLADSLEQSVSPHHDGVEVFGLADGDEFQCLLDILVHGFPLVCDVGVPKPVDHDNGVSVADSLFTSRRRLGTAAA